MRAALLAPDGAWYEVSALRTATRKVWAHRDGQVTLRTALAPLHYRDPQGAWQGCDPTWREGRVERLPYRVALLPSGEIGYRIWGRNSADATTVRLLKPFIPFPARTSDGNRVTWEAGEGLTVTLAAQPWGLQVLKTLAHPDAPRTFLWEVDEPRAAPIPRLPPFGYDNADLRPRATRPWRRRVEVDQQVRIVREQGARRTLQLTEWWTGRTLRPGSGGPCIEDDPLYPVVIDPTFSQTISVGAQDGYEAGTIWYGATTSMPVTYVAGRNGGVRFTNVTIPVGSTASAATLTLYVRSVIGGYPNDPSGRVYADAVDSALAWANGSRPSSGFTKTTANTNKLLNTTGSKVIDVKTVVQEVLSRPGWVSGANLRFGIFWNGINFSGAYLDTVETVAGTPAILDVTYGAVANPLHSIGSM